MEKLEPYKFTTQNELHLWLLPIGEVDAGYFPECYYLLSPEELERNQRYVFEKDRIRDLLTRVFIRKLLAGYLSVDPRELQFESNSFGRPSLVWSDGEPKLDFNLSHAGEMIACGVVQHGPIGIDIEPIDREVKISQASHFFSKIELEELSHLPPEQQKEHFLRLWTLKEAYIKARGAGLSIALDSFAFFGFEEGGMRFWEQSSETKNQSDWSFFSLRPVFGHRVAGAWQLAMVQPQEIMIQGRKFLPFEPLCFENLYLSIENRARI